MIANDIIDKARLALGDKKAERWDDDRLLDLIDEAQKDICLNTSMYRKEGYIPLVVGNFLYDLPDDSIIIHRITTHSAKVPFATKDDMDAKAIDWRTVRSEEVELVIKDSIPMNKLEVYPIPDGEMFYVPTYQGITLDDGTQIELLDLEGVLAGMTIGEVVAEMDSLVGVLTGINYSITLDTSGIGDSSVWGVLADLYELPTDVTTINLSATDYPTPELGVTANLEMAKGSYYATDLWGVMVDIDPDRGYLEDSWGVVSSIIQDGSVLKVYYTASPPHIGSNNTPLVLSNIWETALKYYVVGYALMDDNDAGNITRGEQFLTRYSRELARAKVLSTTEQHDGSGARVTQFQTAFRR